MELLRAVMETPVVLSISVDCLNTAYEINCTIFTIPQINWKEQGIWHLNIYFKHFTKYMKLYNMSEIFNTGKLSYLNSAFPPNVCEFCYKKIGQFYHQEILVNQHLAKETRWMTAGSACGRPRK